MMLLQVAARSAPTSPIVLVVDDEPDILRSLRSLIEAEVEGVRTVGAASGGDALRVLATEQVDVLISDFRMPGMDGLDLIRKAHDDRPELPAIVVTAFADDALAKRVAASGEVVCVFPKPVPVDALLDEIRRQLGIA